MSLDEHDPPADPGDDSGSEERPLVEFFVDPKHAHLVKDLPPVPAGRVTPRWFRETETHYDRQTRFQVYPKELKLRENATVKSCPGIVDYLTGGYVIPLWADFSITFQDGRYRWQSTQDELPLSNHDPGQYHKMPNPGFPVVIKFESPWYLRTPPGYSVRFLPCFYHFEQLWQALPGVVHTDVFHETHVNVRFEVRKGQVVLPQGIPLVHVVPFRRETYGLQVGTGTEADLEAVADGRRKRKRLFQDPSTYPRARGTS